MYYLTTEQSFDAAHFLKNYNGKCKNIHGHRFKVEVKIKSQELKKDSSEEGMIVDFKTLKKDLKELVDYFDHSLIIEENSLKESIRLALLEEDFLIRQVPFRPTAENFSKYFYEKVTELGYLVDLVTVFETPTNGASYGGDSYGN